MTLKLETGRGRAAALGLRMIGRPSMKAWAVTKQRRPLECIEVDVPVPLDSEVLVKVECCGLCHSDLHLREGTRDMGRRGMLRRELPAPIAFGHEIVGTVAALGPQARDVDQSARFIVYPWLGCGRCAECSSGNDHMCAVESRALGSRQHGGFAEYVVVPHPRYLIDLGSLDPAVAATYACSGLTVLSAIQKVMPLPDHQPIIVIGAGGVGLQAISMLRALGHRAIVAVDASPAKRHAAVAAGAATFVCAEGNRAAGSIIAAAGSKVPAVIDLVSSSATAMTAFDCLRRRGKMVQVGLFGGELVAPLPTLTNDFLTIQGSVLGSLQDLREVVALAQSGRLKPIPVSMMTFDQANQALAMLRDGQVDGRLVLQR